MKELSDNAKALLASFAREQEAPATLGQQPWVSDDRLRSPRARRQRAVQMAIIAAAVTVAAVALLWMGLSASSTVAQPGETDVEQAPYRVEPGARPDEAVQPHSGAGTRPHAAPVPNAEPPVEGQPAPTPSEPTPAVVPRSPRKAKPSEAKPSEAKPSEAMGTLAEEIRLLDAARSALQRSDAAGAKRALDQHKRRFPRGELAPERKELRAEVLAGAEGS